MPHAASHHPRRVPRKTTDRGTARELMAMDRRLKQMEATSGYIGTGATVTQATVQTSPDPVNYYPGIVYDSSGLRAYNSGGVITMQINAADGSVTVNGTGVITGGTIQTSSSNPRVVMDSTGLRGYNASGVNTFNLSGTDGSLTATGIIQAAAGSSVPWQTAGFFIGGGNMLNNASAEDPTSTVQNLYFTTGSGVTAGTFTLQYGSGTVTSALAYNSTATQVQTALNAAGVLPSGVTATCTGGPLPGTAISISLAGFSVPNPSTLTVSSSLTGGAAVVGPNPTGWNPLASAAIDFINPGGNAFHGSNVFRVTATAVANVSMTQTLNVVPPPGTKYTLSAYVQSPLAARTPLLVTSYQDSSGNTILSTTVSAAFSTSNQWQRLTSTTTVPPAAARQQVAISGSPTAGSFTLTYNGQTTAAIAYNATAAQVLSAVQALTNVGSSGAINAIGGPLPGSSVSLTFASPPASSPAQMTANSAGLSGGTSPSVTVSLTPVARIFSRVGLSSPNPGEVFYIDAVQLEAGDAPTAFGPRPDEIIANTIQANMIQVANLSAINANLGTITAGSLTSVTVTSSVIQTSGSGARTVLDSTGFWVSNSAGNPIVAINHTSGITLAAQTAQGVTGSTIEWNSTTTSGTNVGQIFAFLQNPGPNSQSLNLYAYGGTGGFGGVNKSALQLSADTVTSGNVAVVVAAQFFAGQSYTYTLLDSNNFSSYMRWDQNTMGLVAWRGVTGYASFNLVAGANYPSVTYNSWNVSDKRVMAMPVYSGGLPQWQMTGLGSGHNYFDMYINSSSAQGGGIYYLGVVD